jgi:hypothetical protein
MHIARQKIRESPLFFELNLCGYMIELCWSVDIGRENLEKEDGDD